MIKIRVLEGALFQQDTHCCSLPSEPLQCEGPQKTDYASIQTIIKILFISGLISGPILRLSNTQMFKHPVGYILQSNTQ